MQEITHYTPAVLAGHEPSFDDFQQFISGWVVSQPVSEFIDELNKRYSIKHGSNTTRAKKREIKKRGKCMTRRAGQDGSKEYIEGGWYKVRIWVDVEGQERREHPSIRICPVEGPGALKTSSQRRSRKRELIAEYTGKNKEVVESLGGVTFQEQAEIMMEQMRTRFRKPVANSTLSVYGCSLRVQLNPILGGMLLSQIYSLQLNLVVRSMLKSGLAPSTMATHIAIAKTVISSCINKTTSERMYPRTWNAEVIDLPIVDPEETNTPSFPREILTGIVAYYDEPRLRGLFTVLAAIGPRICEMLGVEIDKHLSADFRTIFIEQQADGRKVSNRVKRPASRRPIDVHSDIAAVIKELVGDRKSGFLFQTNKGNALTKNFVINKLHVALQSLGYLNEHTGTHFAGTHAFRRSRDTYLRNETSCPAGLITMWIGHAPAKGDMGAHYDKVKRDIKLRLSWAESCGYGFDLPQAVRGVLEIDGYEEAA